MAAIHELLKQVQDPTLRARLTEEFERATQNKKFGLVFEEHIPECTPLYGIGIKKGGTVARKAAKISDTYTVLKVEGSNAICRNKASGAIADIPVNELVAVAEFGEPIFPYLEPVDQVENAPDSALWHTLIEADNYHALQLLEYLYTGKVDCIYIDPPYNTGARDWKYNNDYVDASDAYRHSKWLSMMKRRLKLAKKLLKPDTGVLIITIDEHEIHHLRALLDDVLPETYIQMVTYVINPKGVTQGRFSRVEEYAIYCFMPQAMVPRSNDNLLNVVEDKRTLKPRWKVLLRSGTNSRRADRKNMFYPIYVDLEKGRVIKAGESLPFEEEPVLNEKVGDYYTAWPIRTDGTYGNWGVGYETLNELIEAGYVSLGGYDSRRNTYAITYISKPNRDKIENGEIIITGRDETTGVVNIEFASNNNKTIKTVWHRTLHDAGAYGTDLVSSIIGKKRTFSFPKSVYSERDAIAAIVRDNKAAIILDFFAGSGTTLNAVNLLNAEDGGTRRCILVTNNEISEEEAKTLTSAGFNPGDPEWEQAGICRSVTWPRTKYSISGKREDGTTLEGRYYMLGSVEKEINRSFYQIGFTVYPLSKDKKKQLLSILKDKRGKTQLPQKLADDSAYIVSEDYSASILFDVAEMENWLDALQDQDQITDFYVVTDDKKKFEYIKQRVVETLGTFSEREPETRPMSDGFNANCEYFRLGFLDRDMVSLGRQFHEILPLLWMKAGALGKRPDYQGDEEPAMLVLPENHFAALVDEACYAAFAKEVRQYSTIDTVYFITNSENAYHEMAQDLGIADSYQLYRNYLDNFMIGARRDKL